MSFVFVAFTTPSSLSVGIPQQVLNSPFEQRIAPWKEVSGSQTLYIRPAIGQALWEKELEQFTPPYGIKIFIDDQEIRTRTFSFNDKDGTFVGEPVHWWIFYHIFEPGYFDAFSLHSLRFEYSWFDGYGFYSYDGQNIEFRQQIVWYTETTYFFVTD